MKTRPLFESSRILSTRGATLALQEADIPADDLLERHFVGDWGDLGYPDKKRNNNALRNGGRIMSVYRRGMPVTIWIITEADRSKTTILLPEEY